MTPKDVEKLSTTEIKELLYKQNIDTAGIYDRDVLLGFLHGRKQEMDFKSTLPQSYLKLFEVRHFVASFMF